MFGRHRGFILISAMLLTVLWSLLLVAVISNNLLEFKISGFYEDQVRSFYQAEQQLLRLEQQVTESSLPKVLATSEVRIIEAGFCGVNFYQLRVSATYRQSTTTLQSVVAVISNKKCDSQTILPIKTGRQSFVKITSKAKFK
jgi:Tfp pilus assembly protein PilX